MSALPRDPVCGMPVDPATSIAVTVDDEMLYVCSERCRAELLRRPEEYRAPFHASQSARRIAYFSLEIAVDSRLPTYSGGLGILAGDALRSCADLRVPIVGITLLYRHGYFEQHLDARGNQSERPVSWDPERVLKRMPGTIEIAVESRRVRVRAWRHTIVGTSGYVVPVLFLDTNLPENDERDRRLTDALYSGDARHRLAQEVVLGIGGVRMLGALGYDGVERFHMNEGHAALAAVELLAQDGLDYGATREDCVFTTHTPVPAGHDRFDWRLVRDVVGDRIPDDVFKMLGGRDALNMTELALNVSHYVNGVARKHGQVSEEMFPGRGIRYITNGAHSSTWTSEPMARVFDRHFPEWRDDPAMLRKALAVPPEEIWAAHEESKNELSTSIAERTGRALAPDRMTIGFARRSTAYKRGDLIFTDLARLRAIGRGKIQLVFGGKAHPHDAAGKDLIRRIVAAGAELGDDVPVVYLPDYDFDSAKEIVAGVDVWLNTPLPPLEASGTSGMKAAHNGVPSLSVLDGWWIEGCVEGRTGWAIGGVPADPAHDAASLYDKLENVVLPAFADRARWIAIMQQTIALNASFFNTHRMVQQYVTNAYLP